MHSVLVTGANRGIGLEFVRQLLRLREPPQHVFAGCRTPEDATELQRMAKDNQALQIVKLDVTDETTFTESVEMVDKAVGEEGLGVLINNAGILRLGGTETTTLADMEESYKVNVMGPLAVTQAALHMLTKCMAFDLAPAGILVVALHTGWVRTDMGGKTATLSPKESISGMLNVMRYLTEINTGQAFTWEGRILPW